MLEIWISTNITNIQIRYIFTIRSKIQWHKARIYAILSYLFPYINKLRGWNYLKNADSFSKCTPVSYFNAFS